jgi:hypothetical protein
MHARRLRDHLRSNPGYANYPKYAVALACATWALMHVPVEREAFLIAIESPSLGLLSEITLIASCLLAITSGLIGLFRPGRWSKVLSVLGIVVFYQLLRPVIEFDPVGWLELTVLMIAVLLWDMPASLIDDLFEFSTRSGGSGPCTSRLSIWRR